VRHGGGAQISLKMFDREHNIAEPSEEIRRYIEANQSGYQALRRRAVIYELDGKWVLQACVVEGISINREINIEATRDYSRAVLFEDWLTPEELQQFIAQSLQGEFSLGKYQLKATYNYRQWTKERQPLSNFYMSYAGYVWSSRFQDRMNSFQGELLSPNQPYYPDLHEAVKDWLPFPIYQGSSDQKNGEIILLLPETRAYFEDAIPHENSVDLRISGAEANKLDLEVKGAWWDEDGIHHFTENVHEGNALLNVPDHAKRLDYVLVDTAGAVYDFQQEDVYRHTGLGRKSKTDQARSLANLVTEACLKGEGPRIEFKPFIYPEDSKLFEVIKTVVAFANSEGGNIFLGISNGCEIDGIDIPLKKWAESDADEEACTRYLGEIRGKIRDKLQSEVQIIFRHVTIDKHLIGIIEVSEAIGKPVTIHQDKSLYIRRGSSNTKASPEEWASIIRAPTNGGLSTFFNSNN